MIQCTLPVLRQRKSVLGIRLIVELLTMGDIYLEINSVLYTQLSISDPVGDLFFFPPRGRETETGEV